MLDPKRSADETTTSTTTTSLAPKSESQSPRRSRSRSPAARITAHNRFHHNCCDKKTKPSVEDVKAKSLENAYRRRRSRNNLNEAAPRAPREQKSLAAATSLAVNGHPIQSRSRGLSRSGSSSLGTPEMTLDKESVCSFLGENPDFLQSYVLENVDEATLKKWCELMLLKKDTVSPPSPTSLVALDDARGLVQKLTHEIHENDRMKAGDLLLQVGQAMARAVAATGFNLYLSSENGNQLVKFQPYAHDYETQEIEEGATMASYCAKSRDVLIDKTSSNDRRYPLGVPSAEGEHFALLHPIIRSADDQFVGVFEFLRSCDQEAASPFGTAELEKIRAYLTWAELALAYCQMCITTKKQKDLKKFLLNVVKSIFMEMISMDKLILQIMNFAQKLVDADRASLFLLDSKTNQLYARIFDVTGSAQKAARAQENGEDFLDDEEKDMSREIRFSVGVGIAGYVAETGETLNVYDAYNDPRFNKSIDEQTGYHTRNILCMPICIRGQVIGVVQMVNKILGTFSKDDEEAFETFAIYCGLALHHAKLYDKIRRSEQKYKVSLEVLSYHNSSSVYEVEEITKYGIPTEDIQISTFTFYALDMEDKEKIRKALFMFVDLFGLDRFDFETIVRFLITVKKNYRHVAYHNWTHGFHVANSIYSILKCSSGVFKPLECLAMYVGAICHDLDHRGFNNKFMIDVGSPLAAIYSTSTMEHHHFNMTVNILQQENHNIFSKLNPDEYRQVLGNIKHCILATDLALFFPNKARLTNILKDDAFSWEVADHRMLIESLLMTGCDLCSSYKPWDLQLATVMTIYEEFYKQGDLEIKHGRKPIPIMDRSNDHQQAEHQVGFIGGICLPCYDLLAQVLPNTTPMHEQCLHNLNTWKSKAEEQKLIEQQKKKEAEEANQHKV